jgi:hypothetical protein
LLLSAQGNFAFGEADYCAEVPGGICGPAGQCRPEYQNVSNRACHWAPPSGSDSLWCNCDNWTNKSGDPTACPPDCNTYAPIAPSRYGPLVMCDATCSRLAIFPWGWAGGGNIDVNLYPGYTFDCGSMIGINCIRSDEGTRTDRGSLNIFGGTIFTSTEQHTYMYGTRTALLWVGGSETGVEPCPGYVNMMGGLMVVPSIALYAGDINLTGGTIKMTSSNPADLILSNLYPTTINVAGGTLLLKGDRVAEVQNYNATGHIIPYSNRGNSYLVIDYDITTPGYTTITATGDLGGAGNPDPADGEVEVDINPTLTWSPGNYVQSTNEHRVYLGTSFADVNNATVDNPLGVYMGVRDVNNYTPSQLLRIWTYYWRIDEVNDANVLSPWKGKVWRFDTLSSCCAYPPDIHPRKDSNEPFDINQPSLKWAGAVWATSHQVYFGTSWADVNSATTSTPVIYRGHQTATSYPLSSLSGDYTLSPDETYYWRVDEVNISNPNSPCKGSAWNFRFSKEYYIDDFDVNTMAHWKRNTLTASSPGVTCPGTNKMYTGAVLTWDQVGETLTFHYDNNNLLGFEWYSEARFEYDSTGIDWTANAVPSGTPKILYVTYKGAATNSADPVYDRMYVMLQDSAGHRTGGGLGGGQYGTPIQNPDANATKVTDWTNWRIPLSDLNSPSVNLKAVRYFFLGIGSRCQHPTDYVSNPDDINNYGGKGTMTFDNIRLSQPICLPENIPVADFTGDCVVGLEDMKIMSQEWLTAGMQANIYPDTIVDFKDFAVLANEWMTGTLWPPE